MRPSMIFLLGFTAFTLLAGCSTGDRNASDDLAAPAVNAQSIPADLSAKLTAELERVLRERGITLDDQGKPVGKAVSSLPPRVYTNPVWVVMIITDELQVTWPYIQTGDYDQNGEVNVADLTPIGLYYGATSASPNWGQAYVADGDGNGEVNIADVTPIGLNFGISVDGYVIETRNYAGGPWEEYGHVPLSAAQNLGTGKMFTYTGQGGGDVQDVRVAPVGPVRDFAWNTYQLTSGNAELTYPVLAVVGGKLVCSMVWLEGLGDAHVGFAVADSLRPPSVDHWNFDGDLSYWLGFDFPIPVIDIQGTPLIAFCAYQSATADYSLDYAYRDSGTAPTSGWTRQTVAVSLPNPVMPELIAREGKPALLYGSNGLYLIQGQKAFPSVGGDWLWVSCNPSLIDFNQIDAVARGGWIFSCGDDNASPPNVLFNHSNSENPLVASDFTEYILWPIGSNDGDPSLVLIGGIPCVTVTDYDQNSLAFLQAGSRLAGSSGEWFLHHFAHGTNDEFRYPSMCLVEGRPAVTSGLNSLDFHWTGGQYPDSPEDWRTTRIDHDTGPYGSSLIAPEGLPVVAYGKQVGGTMQLMIAVASEQ